jgi:LysM repeat protein
MYYGGRGADAYLRRRKRGTLRTVGVVVGGLIVIGGVFFAGYLVGKSTNDDTSVTATGSTTTAAKQPGTTVAGAPGTAAPAGSGATAAPTTLVRPEVYIVKAGDSLAKLAKRFSTTIAALVELNGIQNPDRLIEGTRLKIPPPDAAPPPAPAPTAAPTPSS